MKILIKGDKENNFDGILKAYFYGPEETFTLQFNVDEWESTEKHGNIGGNYIQVITPKPMNLVFDHEYDLELEDARKVYATLQQHGWETK